MSKELLRRVAIAGAVMGVTAISAFPIQALPRKTNSSPTLPSAVTSPLHPTAQETFGFDSNEIPVYSSPGAGTSPLTHFDILPREKQFPLDSPKDFVSLPLIVLPPESGGLEATIPQDLNYESLINDPTSPLLSFQDPEQPYVAIAPEAFDPNSGAVSYTPLMIVAEPSTPVPPVPTPALLIGLISFGMAVWWKRS